MTPLFIAEESRKRLFLRNPLALGYLIVFVIDIKVPKNFTDIGIETSFRCSKYKHITLGKTDKKGKKSYTPRVIQEKLR